MSKIEFTTSLIDYRRKGQCSDVVPAPSDFGCSKYWYIEWIYVPEQYRGRGIAAKTVARFCKRVSSKKVKRPIFVALNTNEGIDLNGTDMVKMFKRLGFKVWKKYVWKGSKRVGEKWKPAMLYEMVRA